MNDKFLCSWQPDKAQGPGFATFFFHMFAYVFLDVTYYIYVYEYIFRRYIPENPSLSELQLISGVKDVGRDLQGCFRSAAHRNM